MTAPVIATMIFAAGVLLSWSRCETMDSGPWPIPDIIRGCFYPVAMLIVYLVFLVIYFAVNR